MKAADYTSWSSRTHELDEDQVKDLLRRLKQLGKLPKDDTQAEIVGDDWLFRGISTVLKSKGLISATSLPVLMRGPSYQTHLRVRDQLMKQLDVLLPGKSLGSERASLALLVGNALIERLRIMRIPLTAGTVLKHVPYTMEALEQSFPGYISANLFHFVIQTPIRSTYVKR